MFSTRNADEAVSGGQWPQCWGSFLDNVLVIGMRPLKEAEVITPEAVSLEIPPLVN